MTVIDKYEYERILHTEEGRQEGLEQGKKSAIENIVLNLNAKDMPIEEIANVVEISVDNVKEIINSSLKN